MEDKLNDWGKYSSDGSSSVYNEKEVAYLNKYTAMINNAIDENELYDIIRKYNFNDAKIEEEIKSIKKYIEANGNEYGWNVTKGKKQRIETESPMNSKHKEANYYTPKPGESRYRRKKEYTNDTYTVNQPKSTREYNNSNRDLYYGDSGRYYNKRSSEWGNENKGSNYYGGYNKRGGYYRKGGNNTNRGGYDKKNNRRPFEEFVEVPADYYLNHQRKKNEDDNGDNNKEQEEQVKHKEEIVLENDIEPEKRAKTVESQGVIQSHPKHQYNHDEEEKREIENQSTPSQPIITNKQRQQHQNEDDDNNNYEYGEEEYNEENEEEEDNEQEEREWRAENLKLYLDRLRNYGKYDNNTKAKASSLMQNLEEKNDDNNDNKKNTPEKPRFYNSNYSQKYEIETQQNTQSASFKHNNTNEHQHLPDKMKQYLQERIESITLKGYYDTPNRLWLIKNNIQSNETDSKSMPQPQANPSNYIPLPYYPPPQYPYPYGYMSQFPPQHQITNSTEKPPEPNPYPYAMLVPMYPPPYYDIKPQPQAQPRQDQDQQSPQ